MKLTHFVTLQLLVCFSWIVSAVVGLTMVSEQTVTYGWHPNYCMHIQNICCWEP